MHYVSSKWEKQRDVIYLGRPNENIYPQGQSKNQWVSIKPREVYS